MNDGGDCRTAPATPGLLTTCEGFVNYLRTTYEPLAKGFLYLRTTCEGFLATCKGFFFTS